jgi:hypothetical protein
MYSLRCDKCGWNKEMDSVIYTSCPHCHNLLIIEDYGEDIEPSTLETQCPPIKNPFISKTEKYVKYMKTLITSCGNDIMWLGIEQNYVNYKTRIEMRKLFYIAGGVTPRTQKENII